MPEINQTNLAILLTLLNRDTIKVLDEVVHLQINGLDVPKLPTLIETIGMQMATAVYVLATLGLSQDDIQELVAKHASTKKDDATTS